MEGRRLDGEPPDRNGGLSVNPIGVKLPSGGEAGIHVQLQKLSEERPRKSPNG